jgi:hypothetical protein
MFQHGVDEGDQLAHAGSDGQFLSFARSAKTLIKAADHRIKASCDLIPTNPRYSLNCRER